MKIQKMSRKQLENVRQRNRGSLAAMEDAPTEQFLIVEESVPTPPTTSPKTKYNVGDKVVVLPPQHQFDDHEVLPGQGVTISNITDNPDSGGVWLHVSGYNLDGDIDEDMVLHPDEVMSWEDYKVHKTPTQKIVPERTEVIEIYVEDETYLKDEEVPFIDEDEDDEDWCDEEDEDEDETDSSVESVENYTYKQSSRIPYAMAWVILGLVAGFVAVYAIFKHYSVLPKVVESAPITHIEEEIGTVVDENLQRVRNFLEAAEVSTDSK